VPTDGPEQVLVTRPGWEVEIRLLTPPEASLLSLLSDGESLGEALAAALSCEPETAPAALLATLVSSGMFAAVQGEHTPPA